MLCSIDLCKDNPNQMTSVRVAPSTQDVDGKSLAEPRLLNSSDLEKNYFSVRPGHDSIPSDDAESANKSSVVAQSACCITVVFVLCALATLSLSQIHFTISFNVRIPGLLASNQGILTCDIAANNAVELPQRHVLLKSASSGTVCVLKSKSGEILGRSYDGHGWEGVTASDVVFSCLGEVCSANLPAHSAFSLHAYKSDEPSDVVMRRGRSLQTELSNTTIARFLTQATFGPLLEEIHGFEGTFQDWIQDQMELPASLHREYFRKRANPRTVIESHAGRARGACESGSRWIQFSFSARDVGRQISLEGEGSGIVVTVDGVARTQVGLTGWISALNVPNLQVCQVREYVDGQLIIGSAGCAQQFTLQNPRLSLPNSKIPSDRLFTLGENASLVEMIAPATGVKVLELKSDNAMDGCFEPPHGAVYARDELGNLYQHDGRLVLMDNTLDSPAKDYNLEYCSNVPKTFLNKDSCVIGGRACTAKKYRSKMLTLDEEAILKLQETPGLYVYMIDGLRLDDVGSPCDQDVSRWRHSAGLCTSTVTGSTLSSLVSKLDAQTGLLRDVRFMSGEDCSAATGAQVQTSEGCFTHVHPDTGNVYDFSLWALSGNTGHPGNTVEFQLGNPNPITDPSTEGHHSITYPASHPMGRWEEISSSFPLLGTIGQDIDFHSLPSRGQTDETAAYFGTSVDTEEDEITERCGSPGEIANDPALGNRFLFAQESSIEVQFPTEDQVDFKMGIDNIKTSVWNGLAIKAPDQLRQRVAFALSQILVVSVAQVQGFEDEIYVNYYDIFVRNAFGNYRDVMREVTYSPMMAVMLTYEDSKSLQFCVDATGRNMFPDENYAREVMQLFTIGLYELNMNGTQKLNAEKRPKETYTTQDVMSFAKIFTGFRKQASRSNFEGESPTDPRNRLDPLRLEPAFRDVFPKKNLFGGYIGDGFPICSDLPKQMFLRKGAVYRFIGGSAEPQVIESDPDFSLSAEIKRLVLEEKSRLYRVLCDKTNDKCQFKSEVTLTRNLRCKGAECAVDDPRVVQVDNGYYAYVRPACVKLPLSVANEGVKIKTKEGNAMCANKKSVSASTTCCSSTGAAVQRCSYSGERMSYETAESNCAKEGLSLCDFESTDNSCGNSGYMWTNQACDVQIKVRTDGYVALVHKPSSGNPPTTVRSDSINFFAVEWTGEFPTTANGCLGICTAIGDECVCDIHTKDSVVFQGVPSKDEALDKLKIGSILPKAFKTYNRIKAALSGEPLEHSKDVWVFAPKRESAIFSQNTIFGIKSNGERKYFRNVLSMVHSSTDDRPMFRSPVSFMSFIEPTVRDAAYEVEALLDHLVYHPNTPPFIASRLIQQFITSNPSPRYVATVAKAFTRGTYKGIGSKRYGDLGATIAAVLLDREARNEALDFDPTHGRLREPLLKIVHFLRSMNVISVDNREIETDNLAIKIGQEPHNAPDVFGFFSSEYSPPGPLSKAGLVAPEAHILTTPKVVSFLNGMISAARFGITSCQDGFFANYLDGLMCWRIQFESPETVRQMAISNLEWTPEQGAASATAEDVVDELALVLTAGRLEQSARDIIVQQYNRVHAADGALSALKMAQQLVAASPEFQITNQVQRKLGFRREPSVVPREQKPYKAVVYLFVSGGLDSYNLLVPHSSCDKPMYEEFKSERGSLGMDFADLLPINVPEQNQVCDVFGIHKDLPVAEQLYNAEEALFLSNVGVLVEPLTKEDYMAGTKRIPDSLFAHNVQTAATQTGRPQSTDTVGVLGRAHDVLWNSNYSSGSFSVFGNNFILQPQGEISPEPQHLSYSGIELLNPSVTGTEAEIVNNALLEMSLDESESLFAETWGGILEDTVNQTKLLDSVLRKHYVPTFNTAPVEAISMQLEQVARLIKGREDLKMDRQAFYVELHGLDTHFSNAEILSDRLKDLNAALTDFVAEMKRQGVWDDVVIVQASEFGRTLTGNGAGTDHGWGGNYMLMGGQVKGKRIVGDYPSVLTEQGPANIGRGRLLPTTSWDSVWNAVLEWYGVPESEMSHVLPNRENFMSGILSKEDLFK